MLVERLENLGFEGIEILKPPGRHGEYDRVIDAPVMGDVVAYVNLLACRARFKVRGSPAVCGMKTKCNMQGSRCNVQRLSTYWGTLLPTLTCAQATMDHEREQGAVLTRHGQGKSLQGRGMTDSAAETTNWASPAARRASDSAYSSVGMKSMSP